MNILELFAGSRSFSKVATSQGHSAYTTDVNNYEGIDFVSDIMDINPKKWRSLPFEPDFIWASPPCQTFSVASIGHHWTGGGGAYIPKRAEGYIGLAYVQKAIDIIKYYDPKYWIIENPRGVLRKLNIVKDLKRDTVTYCSYNDQRMKPTDLWNNLENWIPRKMCKNGNRECHHEPAPRGSKTGTQGLKGAYDRSKVPEELCLEILRSL